MRWVLSTPFGVPVEPEVNRILAMASGARRPKAASISGPGLLPVRSASRSAPVLIPWLMMAGTALSASSAGAKRTASSAKTAPGAIRSAMALIRAWSWLCSEYATLTGATGTPAVIAPRVSSRWSTPLPGKQHQRPVRSEAPVQQRLADGAGRGDRRTVAAPAPSAVRIPLGDQQVTRVGLGPCPQAVHDRHRVRGQRVRRAED